MKLMFKLSSVFILLLVVGPYFLLGPEGMAKFMAVNKQIASGMDFSIPGLGKQQSFDVEAEQKQLQDSGKLSIQWSKETPDQGPEQLTSDQIALMGKISAQENIFYRWQDDDGVWQFSQTPNPNTLNLVMRTDPNANLLSGMSSDQIDIALGRYRPETKNSITENNPFAKGEELNKELPIPATIPFTEIPKLIQQAKDVQSIMDQRKQHYDNYLTK